MPEVILTHQDCNDAGCPCGGHLVPEGPPAVLHVLGQPVLLKEEIGPIEGCQTVTDSSKGLKQCLQAKPNACVQPILRVQGRKPVTKSLNGTTDGTNPTPGWFDFHGTSESVLRVGAGARTTGRRHQSAATANLVKAAASPDQTPTQITTGIYHCVRGASGEGGRPAHFLLVLPGPGANLPAAYRQAVRDLGRRSRGFTLSASCPQRDCDPLDLVSRHPPGLELATNDSADLDAVSAWLQSEPAADRPTGNLSVRHAAPGEGQREADFLRAVLDAATASTVNPAEAAGEYPFLGGLLLAINLWHGFDGGKWVRGVLGAAMDGSSAQARENLEIDALSDADVLPGYFFRDHRRRKQHRDARRRALGGIRADLGRERVLNILKQAVRELDTDTELGPQPAELLLEDLAAALSSNGRWQIDARPLPGPRVKALWLASLAVAGAQGKEAVYTAAVAAGLLQGYYGGSLPAALRDRCFVFLQGKLSEAFVPATVSGRWLLAHPHRWKELPAHLEESLQPLAESSRNDGEAAGCGTLEVADPKEFDASSRAKLYAAWHFMDSFLKTYPDGQFFSILSGLGKAFSPRFEEVCEEYDGADPQNLVLHAVYVEFRRATQGRSPYIPDLLGISKYGTHGEMLETVSERDYLSVKKKLGLFRHPKLKKFADLLDKVNKKREARTQWDGTRRRPGREEFVPLVTGSTSVAWICFRPNYRHADLEDGVVLYEVHRMRPSDEPVPVPIAVPFAMAEALRKLCRENAQQKDGRGISDALRADPELASLLEALVLIVGVALLAYALALLLGPILGAAAALEGLWLAVAAFFRSTFMAARPLLGQSKSDSASENGLADNLSV